MSSLLQVACLFAVLYGLAAAAGTEIEALAAYIDAQGRG